MMSYRAERCDFRTERIGLVVWACESTNTEAVEMPDGGSVHLCNLHRGWAAAMGRANV